MYIYILYNIRRPLRGHQAGEDQSHILQPAAMQHCDIAAGSSCSPYSAAFFLVGWLQSCRLKACWLGSCRLRVSKLFDWFPFLFGSPLWTPGAHFTFP